MPRVTAASREANRRALLDAGAEAIAESGLAGARIDDISLAAGLAKGTVYNHFESKDALFEAILREACAAADAGADRVPAAGPAEARLAAFVAVNLEWASERPALARVFARELLAGDDDTRALVLEAAGHCIGVVASILEDGARAGELRSDVPFEALAVTFVCHANLLLGQSWSTGWPAPPELPGTVASLFVRGLLSSPAR
jgi:AcrR family transcriptional regulator